MEKNNPQSPLRHLHAEAGWVCLWVRDSGQGMSEEVKNNIFEPFFSTKESGTGLGLAIVQQIVADFGGHLRVESEVGRGSCFEVWLPRAVEEGLSKQESE